MVYNFTNQTRPNINSSIEIIFIRIHLYLSYVILVFGIFGNIISLFIFTRPNLNKKTNTGILYTLLCVLNILSYINSSLFGNYSLYLFGNKALLLNPQFPCKIEFFTENSLKELLSWLQVLICFDRFILVIYPTKAYIMRKKVVLLSIILATITLIFAVNSYHFIEMKTELVNNSNRINIISCQSSRIVNKSIDYCVQFFIPYLIMVTLNIKVLLRLRQSKRRAGLNSSSRQTNQVNSAANRGTRFTITTVLIDLIFLVFNFPQILISIYSLINFKKLPKNSSIFPISVNYINLLSFSYSAVLVLMFLIFNRIFRKEFCYFFRLTNFVNIFSSNMLNSSTNRV